MPETKIEWRTIVMGTADYETQSLKLGRIVAWPSTSGRLWGCDFCGAEFKIGDTMAWHNVTERDYGQPYGCQDRYWFCRVHDWHYELADG